jgi:hypothetical protein
MADVMVTRSTVISIGKAPNRQLEGDCTWGSHLRDGLKCRVRAFLAVEALLRCPELQFWFEFIEQAYCGEMARKVAAERLRPPCRNKRYGFFTSHNGEASNATGNRT